jgi:protocatechuate 3,4-dioxygenase beta subunit
MRKYSPESLSRRDFIINSTGGFAALLLACGINRTAAEIVPVSANSPIINTDKVCLLTRERTEGPFYISGSTVRRNIRENSEGKEFLLRMQIVDVKNDCRPVKNAVVSIWHCDAGGVYSGYENMNSSNSAEGFGQPSRDGDNRRMPPNGMRPPMRDGQMPPPRDGKMPPPPRDGQGKMMPPPRDGKGMPPNGEMHENPFSDKRYLRGVQITDETGFVSFETIYPGWYAPRTVHIHTKIFLNDKEALTTQMFFSDELNAKIFSTLEPYKTRGVSPFKNGGDDIAGDDPPIITVKEEGDTLIGTIIIGMQSA